MKNFSIAAFWVEGGVWVRERITSATSWTGGCCELGMFVWCREREEWENTPGSSMVVTFQVVGMCVYCA